MPSKLRVLVVDDDADTLFLLGQMLGLAGYESVQAATAAEAIEKIADTPVEVALVDIVIAGQSGLDLLRQIKQRQFGCEAIVFTAHPSVDSAIQALREGAVDYLTKPVTREVLTAALERIADRLELARQRREALALLENGLRAFTGHRVSADHAGAAQPAVVANAGKQYRIGPVVLDLDRFVIEVNGERVHATPSEIEILHYLCRNPGRVITPQEMVQSIRGYRVDPNQAPEIIRPHISNLRRKLMAAEADADVVRTVRGVGYMLKVPSTKQI